MILWIDDLRNPTKYNINAVWAKNFETAKELMLNNQSIIEEIHFDNDLGELEPYKEGRDLFNLLESMLYDGKMKKLKRVFIHSSNSSATKSMMGAKDIFYKKYGIVMKQNYY